MKKLIVVLIVAISSLTAMAQAKFNGVVTFKIDYKGEMVQAFGSMMPNKQIYYYNEGNFKMETTGGMASGQGDVLYLAKEDKTYLINKPAKKAQEMPTEEEGTEKDTDVTVTDLKETATILGYTCDKYKVVIKTKDGEMTQYLWATKALAPLKPKSASGSKLITGITDKVKGMPLKMEIEISQSGMSFTMIMTATDIKEGNPGKDIFTIPADYTVEAFDPKNIRR